MSLLEDQLNRSMLSVYRPHLLVVEDDPDQRKLIAHAAKAMSPPPVIHWAADAAAAVDALEQIQIDLVFADYVLEDSENGWRVLQECLRLQPRARIALNSALPLHPPESPDCEFLQKPYDISQCRNFLARQLELRRLKHPLSSQGRRRRLPQDGVNLDTPAIPERSSRSVANPRPAE